MLDCTNPGFWNYAFGWMGTLVGILIGIALMVGLMAGIRWAEKGKP